MIATIFDYDEKTIRGEWLSAFCARRIVKPREGPSFPVLGREQSPGDWIIDQFHQFLEEGYQRENLRDTVVELIQTHGGNVVDADRDQVVGVLLDVAGELGFVEIQSALAGWVRSGWLDERHVYNVGELELPLRRTVWSLLVGWDYLDGLGPQLMRDLVRLAESNETGTAQMCFLALGQRNPATALEMIPRIVTSWHRTFWERAITLFIQSVGAHVLLTHHFAHAWSRCLGPCFFDLNISRHLREPAPLNEADGSRPNELKTTLEAAGIAVRYGSESVYLRIGREPEFEVDVRSTTRQVASSAPRKRGVNMLEFSQRSAATGAIW